MKKIVHFRNKCIGCGMCEVHAPSYFEMCEKDGMATLKEGIKKKDTFQRNVLPGDEKQVKEASNDCPVKIIKLL